MTSLPTFTAKDFKSDLKPIWCPGCGDFGVLQAMYRALALKALRQNVALDDFPALEEIARSTKGVANVVNNLQVDPKTQAANTEKQ